MNVLFLTFDILPSTGGVQRSVHNLSRALAARGHSVAIASAGTGGIAYSAEQPAPVLRLPIPTAIRPHFRHKLRFGARDVMNIAALAAFCARRSIDVVHCHLINMDTRYALLLRRLIGVKVVITLRGGELCHWLDERPLRRDYVKRMLESADAVTSLSHSQFDDALRLTSRLPNGPLVIPNPAEPDAILAATAGARPDLGSPYILFMGRLEPPKNVDLLVDAYASLIRKRPAYAWDLVIAGDGSEKAGLQRKAGNSGGRIRFLGDLDYARSLSLIRDAHVLVLPSLTGEGCPNVLLEAMSLGTPVIVSDHSPLKEMVEDKVSGEVFPSGNQEALANLLLGLPMDRATRDRYAEAARRRLQERHGFDGIVAAYEEIYASLIGRTVWSTTALQTSGHDRA